MYTVRVLFPRLHPDQGQVEHFQIKWGQAHVVAQSHHPFDYDRINLSAKSKWGQIPVVPICSDRPEIKLKALESGCDKAG